MKLLQKDKILLNQVKVLKIFILIKKVIKFIEIVKEHWKQKKVICFKIK